MKQKIKNISSIKDCYGCGVCAVACPKHIISIRLNYDGFYEPYINDISSCVNCSICLLVCSYYDNNVNSKALASYAGWSKDIETHYTSSSGGIVFELGKYLMSQGYKVCGVRYNVIKERAEHYVAKDAKDLLQSVGSKYIQSYTVEGFSQINTNDKYLIIGTPCQVDSFRKYIRRKKIEDHFILVDFFCHGVPSMLLWEKYLNILKMQNSDIKKVSWRDKRNGWHDSYAILVNSGCVEYYSPLSRGDLFF